MLIVSIQEAKVHLSKLVDQAVKGEPFVIAKAGKPLVRVAALDAQPTPPIPRRRRRAAHRGSGPGGGPGHAAASADPWRRPPPCRAGYWRAGWRPPGIRSESRPRPRRATTSQPG